MKYIITIVATLAVAASSYAGCGKKVASIGKLDKFDAASKAITINVTDSSDPKEVKSKSTKLTMTPDTKILPKGSKIASLVGKNVSVVSEHGKIDFVIVLAAKAPAEAGGKTTKAKG